MKTQEDYPAAEKSCSDCLPSKLGSCVNSSSRCPGAQQPQTVPILINAAQPFPTVAIAGAAVASTVFATTPAMTTSEVHSSAAISTDSATTLATTALEVHNSRSRSSFSHSTNSLPAFTPVSSTPFHWGNVMGQAFCEDIQTAYEAQSFWRKNTFSPPSGHAGTEFMKKHTRLLRADKDRTPMEHVALKAIKVMPSLLLQKPHAKAGSKEFSQHLTRRISLWKAGNIKELLKEARSIQSQLPVLNRQRGMTTQKLNRRFASLIHKVKFMLPFPS